jgi:nitrogen fixation protein NifU and related proteins
MDLKDLYRDVIVDHNRQPRNFGKLDHPDTHADGHNPLCGDKLSVYLKLDNDRITDARFDGSGCAISVASASLLTEAIKGKTIAEVKLLFSEIHDVLTHHDAPINVERLGKLAALTGVRDFPARVKCATLCWHTLDAALQAHQQHTDASQPISTE